jgi:hypothetical protein
VCFFPVGMDTEFFCWVNLNGDRGDLADLGSEEGKGEEKGSLPGAVGSASVSGCGTGLRPMTGRRNPGPLQDFACSDAARPCSSVPAMCQLKVSRSYGLRAGLFLIRTLPQRRPLSGTLQDRTVGVTD